MPNPRMQPTGRSCPGHRPGASSLEDEAERRIVRARARWPAADAHFVRPQHRRGSIYNLRRALGLLLALLSLAACVQSLREYVLWETGREAYSEDSYLELPFSFAGHTFRVADDQPIDTAYSEEEFEGTAYLVMDGHALTEPARALVRRGRSDLGRYHLWIDAWKFINESGDSSLWLTRRLQQAQDATPAYEVITLAAGASPERHVYAGWQLGGSYPLFRATKFLRTGVMEGVPLSMLSALYFWPILLVFPLGSFVLGTVLLWRGRRGLSGRVNSPGHG